MRYAEQATSDAALVLNQPGRCVAVSFIVRKSRASHYMTC
jgi:hypothetical protein